jgi:type VI secretion system secreted protein VgrG
VAPRVDGYELARVCGEAESEYAQIDEHGRYKCRILFDESDLVDGSATTFVRMMQPHAGSVEGFHFPLRKGTEVLLFFLGGNPDRPVIAGSVPNPLTRSPVTSANHTKNVIQTGARNRLEIEDLAGQERITLSTPYSNTFLRMGHPVEGHELTLHTDDHTLLDSGKDFDLKVGLNGGGTWHAIVQDNLDIDVNAGNVTLDVTTGTYAATIKAGSTTTVQAGDTMIDTTGKTTIKSTGDVALTSSGGPITIGADTGPITIDAKAAAMTINAKGDISVTGAQKWYQQTYGDYFKFNVSSGASITLGFTNDVKIGMFNEALVGGKISVSVGGIMEITAAYKFAITAAIALEMKYGASLCLNSALELSNAPIEVENKAVALMKKSMWLANAAFKAEANGMTIFG